MSTRRLLIVSGLFLLLVFQLSLSRISLPSADVIVNNEKYPIIDASSVMSELEDLSSNNVSLNMLRSISTERSEGIRVLYDVRTKLGNRPARFLEVGDYTGASLMLKHPFPTYVKSLDCDLSRFGGDTKRKEIAVRSTEALGVRGCGMKSPWKLDVGCSPDVLPEEEKFDIIFVNAVWSNYNHLVNLVRPGGFLVFGQRFPIASNTLENKNDVVHIGAFDRAFDSAQANLNSKEHIFQKRGHYQPIPQPIPDAPMLCVVVCTYRRKDGSTLEILEAMWKMLWGQSYPNWKLYLTGDHYDNDQEWSSLTFANESRVSISNLPEPGERTKMSGSELWHNAGMAALNEGIRRVLSDGHEWIVRFDDDDQWDSDHLENIHTGVRSGATFVYTSCQYRASVLPPETLEWSSGIRHDVPPRPCKNIHSSVAFNVKSLPSRYEVYPGSPADANMWARIQFDDNFFPAFVPCMSCYHLSEQGVVHPVRIVRKSLIDEILPTGWYSREQFNDYHTLATHNFDLEVSQHCVFVVGPDQGHRGFYQLAQEDVPYHIRLVQEFKNMSVWKRR
jgi:hypothetical protein